MDDRARKFNKSCIKAIQKKKIRDTLMLIIGTGMLINNKKMQSLGIELHKVISEASCE